MKDKLPDNEADKVQQVQDDLDSIIPDDEGGGIGGTKHRRKCSKHSLMKKRKLSDC